MECVIIYGHLPYYVKKKKKGLGADLFAVHAPVNMPLHIDAYKNNLLRTFNVRIWFLLRYKNTKKYFTLVFMSVPTVCFNFYTRNIVIY